MGTHPKSEKMQVVHDHPEVRARPDTVFYQRHNTRARWRDPRPGYYSGHQAHVCYSCGQHSEQGKSKPKLAHSIFPSRCPTIEIQPERADVCVLLQRSIDFRKRFRDIAGCGRHPYSADRSSAAQVPHMALSNTASGGASSLDYGDLLAHFRIPSLASRRVQHDLLFIRNLFHSRLDSHILLRSFYLHAPTRSTRTQPLFYEPRPRVNTVKRGLFLRVPQLANSFLRGVPEVDFFADALVTFKAHVVKYVSRFKHPVRSIALVYSWL